MIHHSLCQQVVSKTFFVIKTKKKYSLPADSNLIELLASQPVSKPFASAHLTTGASIYFASCTTSFRERRVVKLSLCSYHRQLFAYTVTPRDVFILRSCLYDKNAASVTNSNAKWWKEFQLRKCFRFFPSTFPLYISEDDVRIGVMAAMCLWELNSKIRFHKDSGDNKESADIKIKFGRSQFELFYLFSLWKTNALFVKIDLQFLLTKSAW